ncbi:MAG: hypothetical protein HY530_08705 [Chloroflexi bacterium]|nr:hypothetical protein [Chloroflexota bacterium]
MATQRKNLPLYLALACFLGIIAIFIVDGYMGIYDTVTVTSGELPQKIEADFWARPDNVWSTGGNRGEKVFFRYEVDNRQFSSYAADVEVSVWRSQEKVRDLLARQMSVGAFEKGEMEWAVDTVELLPSTTPPEQSFQFTVLIKRGELERRVIIYINPSPFPPKPVPAR